MKEHKLEKWVLKPINTPLIQSNCCIC